ncbi:MAG: hypothetical protein JWP44_4501 [Mucilaginibacter sp.]|nr:hypothetical protein [Mucilaginibacter sp.]
MGTTTGISWTDATWNPVRGCTRVSAGCQNCYAEVVAARFSGPGQPYEGLARRVNGHARWTNKVIAVEKHLHDPLRWKTPRRVFVNSMSDLFHPDVEIATLIEVFAVMALAESHTFQILTKRPERMARLVGEAIFQFEVWSRARQLGLGPECRVWPLHNVWLGTSVEDQAAADQRIPHLLRSTAAVRFLSCEPLLSPVHLEIGCDRSLLCGWEDVGGPGVYNTLTGEWWPAVGNSEQEYAGRITDLPCIDWVIVGGESGAGARSMDNTWARSLARQCQDAEIAFFGKQAGTELAREHGLKGKGEGPLDETAPVALSWLNVQQYPVGM